MLSLTRTLTPSHNSPLYSHYYTLPNHSILSHTCPLSQCTHTLLADCHIHTLTYCPHPLPQHALMPSSVPSPSCLHTHTHIISCACLHPVTHARSHTMLALSHVSISMTLVITFMFAMPSLFPQDTSVHSSFSHGPHDGWGSQSIRSRVYGSFLSWTRSLRFRKRKILD